MKIAVTGANGYIGYHVVKELLDRGHTVVAVDFTHHRVDERARMVKANVLDEPRDYFNEWGRPDGVIHLAVRNITVHGAVSHIEDLPKHFMFIKTLADSGLKQVVVSGSMHDMGYVEGMITQDTPANPKNFYGISKNALQEYLQAYLKDKPVCFQWVRFFYTYGDDAQSAGSLFSKILELEHKGEVSFPFTDGKNQYDYIHIDDLAKQVTAVLEQREVAGVINCCSGKPQSMKERVEEFLAENKLKIKPDFGKFPSRPYDSPVVYGDATQINDILQRGKK